MHVVVATGASRNLNPQPEVSRSALQKYRSTVTRYFLSSSNGSLLLLELTKEER